MDREEYREKLDQLTDAVNDKDYKKALQICDEVDWRRVKSLNTLNMVADVYEVNREYSAEKQILLLAYERASIGRSILYRLVEVCLKLNQVGEADRYFKEYSKTAKNDSSRCILQYKLYRATNAPLEAQIDVLEEYREREYTERWAYELAALYAKAGDRRKCVDACDDLILWFGEGRYVLKAMELKMRYEPLTPSQQKSYEKMKAEGSYQDHEENGVLADAEDRAGTRLYREAGITGMSGKIRPSDTASGTGHGAAAAASPREEEIPSAESAVLNAAGDTAVSASSSGKSSSGKSFSGTAARKDYHGRTDTYAEEAADIFGENDEKAAEDDGADSPAGSRSTGSGFRARFAKTFSGIFGSDEDDDDYGDDSIDASYTEDGDDAGTASEPEEQKTERIPEYADGLKLRSLQKENLKVDVTDEAPSADRGVSGAAGEEEPAVMPETDGGTKMSQEDADVHMMRRSDIETEEPDLTGMIMPAQAESSAIASEKAVRTEQKIREAGRTEAEEAAQPSADGSQKSSESTEQDSDSGMKSLDAVENAGSAAQESDTASAAQEPVVAPSAAEAIKGLAEGVKAGKKEEQAEAAAEAAGAKKKAEEENDDDMKVVPDKETRKPHYIEGLEVPDPEPSPEEKKQHTHTISLDTIGENTVPISIDKILSEETPEERRIRILNKEKPTRMSEEQRKIFTYFARVPGMDGQILEAINSVYRHAGEKTSLHGNIAIMGARGTGKSRLANGLIVAMCRDLGMEACKMARITGKKLNEKDAAKVVSVMAGGFLIIEDISAVNTETLNTLNQAMEFRTDCMVVIIEDEKTRMRAFLKEHPSFAGKFEKVISVPVFTNDELVTFARTYATENGCKIDDMAILALYTIIGNIQSEEKPATISTVKEIIDKAILHATKGKRRRGNIDAEKTGKWVIIHEKDLSAP